MPGETRRPGLDPGSRPQGRPWPGWRERWGTAIPAEAGNRGRGPGGSRPRARPGLRPGQDPGSGVRWKSPGRGAFRRPPARKRS